MNRANPTHRALVAVLLLAGCPPKIPPGPAPLVEAGEPVRLVERRDASSPNVYLQAIVAAGSGYDASGMEGAAWVTARSLVEAGAGDRTAREVSDALFPTGNELELVVDREWVSLRLRCHHDQAALCVSVFTDVLAAPRFDEADVARVRDEALYDVTDGALGDEEELGREVLNDWLFEAHPYGHPVRGRAGTLPLLDARRAREFYAEHYGRGAVIAGIAGNYDDALRDALVRGLDRLAPKPAVKFEPMPPLPVTGRSLLAVDTGTDVTGFSLGHPLKVTRNHEDFAALYLAMTALGAHRQSSGRLFRVLRTARGLNYGTYAYAEPFVQRGWEPLPEQGVLRQHPYFSLWIRPTSLENGPFALKLALDELEKLALDGLTPEEFDATRSYLLGHTPLEAPDAGRRLAYALDAAAAGTPDLQDWLPGALEALTLEDVNEAVQYWIQPSNLRIVAVSGDAEGLVKRLVEDTATPIVYNDVTPDDAQAARDAEVAGIALGIADSKVVPAEGIFR